MSTIDRRISDLQQFMERQARRKNGPVSFVEEVRRMLHTIDEQVELGTLPGETLWDTMVRRLQVADGYDLSLMPGATLSEKLQAVDDAANNESFVVSAEARHAARHCVKMYEGI